MKIDSVHYSRKKSDGNYGNAELGMHAQLEEDDSPTQVAEHLQTLVTATLHEQASAAEFNDMQESHRHELDSAIESKRIDLDRMERQWTLARAFLEQHGVDVSRYTDVPF